MCIIINSLSYIHPDGNTLFENINLSIAKEEKTSLIGDNGAGKSTILQIITGDLQQSEGEIICSEKPYYVPQHFGQFDNMLIAEVLQINDKLRALNAILKGDVSELNFEILNDDWNIEERIKIALSFWNLDHIDLHLKMNELSGGEKTKIFLAGILIHDPSTILLDEPTNHLDTRSRAILYDFIKNNRKTFLIVSHDRQLLNMIDKTIEISSNSIEIYGGNYDFYKQQKDLKLEALQAQFTETKKDLRQTQQKAREITEQRQKLEAKGKRLKIDGGLPRIVLGGMKNNAERSSAKINSEQTDKIEKSTKNLTLLKQQIKQQEILKIDIKASDLHKGKILIDAKGINISYNGNPLWTKPITFQICSGKRVQIVGDNGSGKSSLVKLITGEEQVSEGELLLSDFSFLYVDQEYSVIENHLTVFNQVQKFNDRHLLEHDLKMLLHHHQFDFDYWNRPCHSLSGGEKMKLLLCCLEVSENKIDVIILDEPTNNLDIHSQEILTQAIKGFDGTVLVISHDKYFINNISISTELILTRKKE